MPSQPSSSAGITYTCQPLMMISRSMWGLCGVTEGRSMCEVKRVGGRGAARPGLGSCPTEACTAPLRPALAHPSAAQAQAQANMPRPILPAHMRTSISVGATALQQHAQAAQGGAAKEGRPGAPGQGTAAIQWSTQRYNTGSVCGTPREPTPALLARVCKHTCAPMVHTCAILCVHALYALGGPHPPEVPC